MRHEVMIYQLGDVALARRQADSEFRLEISRFDLPRGCFCFVVGESGSGKSTLLDALSLLLRPKEAGCFRFQPFEEAPSFDLQNLSEGRLSMIRRKNMGHVLQSGGIISSFSVRENILLSVRLAGVRLNRAWFSEIVDRLGLADCLRRSPANLSGGQRQRVAIARAILHRPSIVLADEPTAAVDQPRAEEICRIFRDLAKDFGCTVLMVTHNETLASQFGDATLHLPAPTRAGRLTQSSIHWSAQR